MKLRKFIATTIREYLNEQQYILKETHYIGYHGSENNIVGDFKNLNSNIIGFYFSSDYENAKTYGNNVNNI